MLRVRPGLVGLLVLGPALAIALLWSTGVLVLPAGGDGGSAWQLSALLPGLQAVRDVSAGLTLGALVVAGACLAPEPGRAKGHLGAAQRWLMRQVASVAALSWCAASLALVVATYLDLLGGATVDPALVVSDLMFFAGSFDPGRYLITGAVAAAIVAVGARSARTFTSVGFLVAITLAGLWPIALSGHSAGAVGHDLAVGAQIFHVVGLSVWAGGLAALVLVRPRVGQRFPLAVRRYSRLAGWSVAAVAAAGVGGALLRVPSGRGLDSAYGAILALKVLLLGLLVTCGWWQRRRMLPALETKHGGAAFARLALLEVALLAAGAGAGVALARTPPPTDDVPASPMEMALGASAPPPLGAAEWFDEWRFDALFVPLLALLLGWYLRAWWRLRRRGDAWPVARLIAWVLGILLLSWAIAGSPGVYGRVLFSMHMVQHMTIATAAPIFLVLGAPVTLAMRTLPKRYDGSRGPREWILAIVHSRLLAVLSVPWVAAMLFVVSLVAFYYSSLFETSLSTHTGHVLMTLHFVLTGYVFASCLVGVDPGPPRVRYPLRALTILVTFGFHALFSVSLMASDQVLAQTWFAGLNRAWGRSLVDDQYVGASLSWALGDYPLGIMAVALVVSWVGSDARERRRFDRHEDRSGGAALASYNDYLAKLSRRGPTMEDREEVEQ